MLAGARQLTAMTVYGDLGTTHSLPHLLHAWNAPTSLALLGDVHAQAAASLHRGDLDAAQALVAPLPDDVSGRDLRGRLAQARGDDAAAITAYIGALDAVRAQALIDTLGAHDAAAALVDEQLLVDRLGADPSATEIAANAWWRLGQLRAQNGAGAASEAAYARALALAPNEETYLLAIGYQRLADGAPAASLAAYDHAAQAVPDSADAFGGIAAASAAAGDCTRARSAYARFLALRVPGQRNPRDDAAVGGALRRCVPA